MFTNNEYVDFVDFLLKLIFCSSVPFRSGLFAVGPESAGAHPGPVCYRKGGPNLTITDANLVLGRLLPEYFPKIFGHKENESLDKVVKNKFGKFWKANQSKKSARLEAQAN